MKTRKILIAIDGSSHSLAAVRYITATLKPDRASLRLLHVMSPKPESFWDEEIDPAAADSDPTVEDWQRENRRRMTAFAAAARKIACDAGFDEDAVLVDLKPRERGVARDIFKEAQRGYDAVVMGRRGENPSTQLPIGSVANKIAHVLHHFPVWIVAEPGASTRSVLVAMDGSEGSRRALDHAAAMIGPRCSTLCLFHVIRGGGPAADAGKKGGGRLETLSRERFGRAERTMKMRMDGCAKHLAGRIEGSPRIVTRIVTGVPSRAGAILREVDSAGYGTVVIGRRGLSEVSEFAMGRVCAKVMQMALKTTVWIVN